SPWKLPRSSKPPEYAGPARPRIPRRLGLRRCRPAADLLLPCCGFFPQENPMRLLTLALAAALAAPLAAQERGPAADALTLDRIMADPDWIGAPVEAPYWA